MRPVFIFGCDAGANALLGALLASHPLCTTAPLPQLASGSAPDSSPELEDAVAEIREHFQEHLWEADLVLANPVSANLASQPPGIDAQPALVTQLVTAYACAYGHTGAKVWLEHAPTAPKGLLLLAERFPEAKFVHLVRDGRAVAASQRSSRGAQPALVRLGRSWRDDVKRGLEAETRLGSERCRRIGYEALLTGAAGVLATVARFIDVPSQGFDEGAASLGRDYTQHLEAWRRQLSDHDVQRFEDLGGEALTALGYPLAFSQAPLPTTPVWLRLLPGWSSRPAPPRRAARDSAEARVRLHRPPGTGLSQKGARDTKS